MTQKQNHVQKIQYTKEGLQIVFAEPYSCNDTSLLQELQSLVSEACPDFPSFGAGVDDKWLQSNATAQVPVAMELVEEPDGAEFPAIKTPYIDIEIHGDGTFDAEKLLHDISELANTHRAEREKHTNPDATMVDLTGKDGIISTR